MKKTFGSNGVIVFAFVVVSVLVLAGAVFLYFTGMDLNPQKKPSLNGVVIQTPTPTLAPTLYPACEGFGVDKKWGLIDATGKFVLEPKYDGISDFQVNGYAAVRNIIDSKNEYKESVGLIDSTGKEVLPLIYSGISDFNEGLSILTVEGSKYVKVINEKLEKVFSMKADFIEDFHDGVAVYSGYVKGEFFYGYVDKSGKILTKEIFGNANDVFNGKALIDESSRENARIIDTSGTTLLDLSQYFNVNQLGNGLITFAKDPDGKTGLMDMNGKILIQPAYANIDEFIDGYSIVGVYGETRNKSGVVNEKGEIVIPVKVQLIQNFGKGIFGVYKDLNEFWNDGNYVKNALMDSSGKVFTDYRFYNVTRNIDDNFSVSDGAKTFLVDQKGVELKTFPKLEGVGTIKKVGELYKCDLDGILSYVDSNGKLVWKQNLILDIAPNIGAKTTVFRNDYLRVVRYPVILGSINLNVQKIINKKIEKIFKSIITPSKESDLQTESIEVDFDAKIKGNILTITLDGYDYPIGAAHGMPIRDLYHFDITTGKIFNFDDLIITGNDYETKLNSIIRKQALKEKDRYFEPSKISINGKDTLFDVSKNSLTIIFSTYEIAPYAGGMPEFEIKFSQIESIINKEGAFWKALQAEGPQP